MEEMVKAVNVYEKDGVLVEETIEVPVDELETLKEYMGVGDDNQEEYNTEATGETEDLSDVEEGEVEPEDESGYDEPEELEEIIVDTVMVDDDVPVAVEAILLDQDEEVFLESFLDFDIEEDEDDDEEDID